MKHITTVEFEDNLDYYIALSMNEDIYITKNGEIITVLTNAEKHRLAFVDQLCGSFGKIDENIDYDKILKHELMKKTM